MKESWWDIGNIVTHEDYKGLGLLVDLTTRSLVYMWTITKEALTFTRIEKENRKALSVLSNFIRIKKITKQNLISLKLTGVVFFFFLTFNIFVSRTKPHIKLKIKLLFFFIKIYSSIY